MNPSKSGHIYLIKARGATPARYKIGKTQQGRMAKRFEELNSSQSAFPLELVKVINVADRHSVEAELHRQFKSNRKHGEWFEFPRGSKEVERVMGQYGDSRNKSGVENWRIITFIVGIIFLLMAYQNHTSQPQENPKPQQQSISNF